MANQPEVLVEFSVQTQTLDALHAAVYRLIGTANCQIDRMEGQFICRLTSSTNKKALDPETLRVRFLDLVADENVRERIAAKTEPVRNLILSLAFGSLATESRDQS